MEEKLYLNVVNYIKDEIRNDRLKIGDRLPTERELSAELEISRNSIREALRTLNCLGILESRQGSGNYLTGDISRFFTEAFELMSLVGKTSPLEINQMRCALEHKAYSIMFGKLSEEKLDELRQAVSLVVYKEADLNASFDLLFHQKVIELAGNSLMTNISFALASVFLVNVEENLRSLSDEDRKITHQCHHDLVDALSNLRWEKGYNAISRHYELVDETLRRM